MGDLLDQQWLIFAASLAGVVALVVLTWALGFRQQGQLESADEARELMLLAPGGFDPVDLALDRDGKAALARDAEGRWLVLLAHGNQFVARPVTAADLRRDGDAVRVRCDGRDHVIAPDDNSIWLLTDIDDS